MPSSVVVFCSSSRAISPMYFSEITLLGRLLAESQITVVYGGASVGLMGALADAVLAAGGKVIGVIPEYLNEPGMVHEGLSELVVVSDLLDRKKKMLGLANAAIACPGGIGTMDEITEVMALKQLKEHQKPIIFHNFLNFWDPLLEYFEELTYRGMISMPVAELAVSCESAQDVVSFLKKGTK